MNKAVKRLEAMRANPKGDWKINDIEVVCRQFSAVLQPPKHGSHYKVIHPETETILTIPAARPIKPVYIRMFVDMIDSINA